MSVHIVYVKGDGCRLCNKIVRPLNPRNRPLIHNGRKPR